MGGVCDWLHWNGIMRVCFVNISTNRENLVFCIFCGGGDDYTTRSGQQSLHSTALLGAPLVQ